MRYNTLLDNNEKRVCFCIEVRRRWSVGSTGTIVCCPIFQLRTWLRSFTNATGNEPYVCCIQLIKFFVA